MNIKFLRMNVEVYLEMSNNDYIKAMKYLDNHYRRGVFTNEEYDMMVDILAGYVITGRL